MQIKLHTFVEGELQRTDVVADDNTICIRIAREYLIDSVTGKVSLSNPLLPARWQYLSGDWHEAERCHKEELEHEFIVALIKANQ